MIYRLLLALTVFVSVTAEGIPARSEAQLLTGQLDGEWAEIFYNAPEDDKAPRLKALLSRSEELVQRFPGEAEPLIIQAVILCSLAGVDWGLDSLARLEQSRDLLIHAIDIDPRAMDAAAYITLGNFYYRLPGWPISFGDEEQARRYLESALVLFPSAIDSNYFMGDFLLDQEEYDAALPYLERAERAPVRPYQQVSDQKLKEQLPALLQVARSKGGGRSDFFSKLLPDLDKR